MGNKHRKNRSRVPPIAHALGLELREDWSGVDAVMPLLERMKDEGPSAHAAGCRLRVRSGLDYRFALIDEQGNLPVSSLEDRGGSRVELVRSARARRRHRGG